MACPKILFLAAFLLLLSFWVDLCHQANDEEDDDEECSPQETLLERASNKSHSNADSHRGFCSFRSIHVGSRQKVVILVYGSGESYCSDFCYNDHLCCPYLDWDGKESNRFRYGCPGLLLFSKMRKVRSETAASETWKMHYYWQHEHVNGVYTSCLLILYYFIGSSVPSAYILWVMRELPPSIAVNVVEESMTIAFIHDSSVTINPQSWTAAASSQNQVSRARPI